MKEGAHTFLSVITIGELRRGIERIRRRGDTHQALKLEAWLVLVLDQYASSILDFYRDAAQVWGRLRAANHDNALDKQIAAIALVNDSTLVARNTNDFEGTGARLFNPFEA